MDWDNAPCRKNGCDFLGDDKQPICEWAGRPLCMDNPRERMAAQDAYNEAQAVERLVRAPLKKKNGAWTPSGGEA